MAARVAELSAGERMIGSACPAGSPWCRFLSTWGCSRLMSPERYSAELSGVVDHFPDVLGSKHHSLLVDYLIEAFNPDGQVVPKG